MPKYRILVIVLAAALALAGFRIFTQDKVETVHPKRGPAVQAAYATGTVEASVMLPLSSRVSARLGKLLADEGDRVTAGQVLAQLEDADVQKRLDQLRAKLTYAEQEFERAKKLVRTRSFSEAAYDLAASNLETAKAALAQAEAEASYLQLTAPENGRIIQRDGEVGQLIPAAQAVFWLATDAPLRISAEVDEEDIALVKTGQKVLIRADAFPGKVFNGEVQAMTPKGDPVARSYRVRIAFSEETPLRIGMTAETNIILREAENALLLPASAVAGGKVWLLENGKAVHRPVETGADGAESIEILSGMEESAEVIRTPKEALKVGDTLRGTLVSW